MQSLAGTAGLTLPPGLGTWTLDGHAEGPPEVLALGVRLDAGRLRATADGWVDLRSRSADGLRLSADLPAMELRPAALPGVAWRRIGIAADLERSRGRPPPGWRLTAHWLGHVGSHHPACTDRGRGAHEA